MYIRKIKIIGLVLAFITIQISIQTLMPRVCDAGTITALEVAQKGMGKLHGLMAEKKISVDWADGFSQVTVSKRNIKGFPEYVLEFSSSSGSPGTLTLYYSISGQYIASSLGD